MSDELKEIPTNVREMADDLKASATVEDNVISFKDNAFKDHLPAEFKFKQMKQYEKHKIDFGAAVHLAAGEIGNNLIKDKGYEKVTSMPVDMIYSQLGTKQSKYRSGVSKMDTEKGEVEWEQYGALTSIFSSRIDKKVGSVKIVKEHIMKEAKELFGK